MNTATDKKPTLSLDKKNYVEAGRMSAKVACLAFGISQTCYRYEAKLNAENEVIADWLVRLTTSQRNWGFGLCFLYLRNVKSFSWNPSASTGFTANWN
jgi:putative transposase